VPTLSVRLQRAWVWVVVLAVLCITPWPILALAPARKGEWYIVAVPVDNGMNVAPVVGRSPQFAIVDVKTGSVKVIANPYQNDTHGAGLNCARLLFDEKVGVVIVHDIGPEPFKHFTGRGVAVYTGKPTTVADAIAQLKAGMLAKVTRATVTTHYGLGKLGLASPSSIAPCPMSGAAGAAPQPAAMPVASPAPAMPAPLPAIPPPATPAIPPVVPTAPFPQAGAGLPNPSPSAAEAPAPAVVGPFQIPRLAMEVAGTGRGVRIFRIYGGSVAQAGGLRAGDLILSFGTQRIIDMATFVQAASQAPEEQSVTVEVFRQGQVFRAQVTMGEGEMESVTLPRDPAPPYSAAAASTPVGSPPGTGAASQVKFL